ncbi:MAG TPA: hypothetical protein VMT98_18575 [Verrucomicrobiae bacterium]|jgi:hypothetical protein|nr:hypothetical protein [Verrucomicrobiae bacterium]
MNGRRPGRPKRAIEVAQLVVRLPVPLFEEIKTAAKAEGRSLSAHALMLILAGMSSNHSGHQEGD